jgi:hypothetical protein
MSVDLNFGEYDPGSTSTFIDPASDPNTNPNVLGDANSPFKRGDVFVNQTTLDPSSAIAGLKKFVTDNKAFITGGTALASAFGGRDNVDKKTGYQGGIPQYLASRSMIAAPPTRAQGYRPGAGGIDYGGDVSYKLAPGQDTYANLSGTSGSAAGANLTSLPADVATAVNNLITNNTNTAAKTDTTKEKYLGSTTAVNSTGLSPQIANSLMYRSHAAKGANTADFDKYGGFAAVQALATANGYSPTPTWIANYEKAAGFVPSEYTRINTPGSLENLAFLAGTYNNPNNKTVATNTLAEGGMAKGRYLQGKTDGMADKLPAQIGKDQPAALSHGEFVIPADVVSHMGNGNSDAGAKKLYQMMDKIRMARTGNKKQGKKINPDKFMPGGLASAYAKGGSVKHFVTGGTTLPAGTIGTESNLSNYAGPYVTGMLGQGQALANMPYQAYLGQLTAGQSPLQSQGFGGAADMTVPSSLTSAAQTAGDVATAAKGLPAYGATTFGNQYTAPTAGTPTTFTNQYTTPGAYSPTTSSFDSAQAKAYMNPYLEQSLTPQLDEARRQSQITQQQNDARMTQGGAFGGGRNAILNAETQRNLGTNLANITGQGYNTAYDKAMAQFNADQQRKMQDAQFGAQQGMTAAQLKAQFGLSEQQANEAARQFAAQQKMTSAQLGAQYGLAGQQASEQSKQYGAGYGLQGLQTGLQAAQTQGALGTQINQAGLGNLNAMLTAGAQQRGIESEGIAADKAQFEEARANPYKMLQFQQSLLQGLPLAAQSYQGISPSSLTKAAQGATTVNQLLKNLGLMD